MTRLALPALSRHNRSSTGALRLPRKLEYCRLLPVLVGAQTGRILAQWRCTTRSNHTFSLAHYIVRYLLTKKYINFLDLHSHYEINFTAGYNQRQCKNFSNVIVNDCRVIYLNNIITKYTTLPDFFSYAEMHLIVTKYPHDKHVGGGR